MTKEDIIPNDRNSNIISTKQSSFLKFYISKYSEMPTNKQTLHIIYAFFMLRLGLANDSPKIIKQIKNCKTKRI